MRSLICGWVLIFLHWEGAVVAQETVLPVGTAPEALASEHFPDRIHEFVWRNWNVIEPTKLAKTIGATSKEVEMMAASMGLPAATSVPADLKERGYSTIIRRNWHLLPYSQLMELLDMSEERLSAILREEDFLYIKLGSLKPKCPPLNYKSPDELAKKRAVEIRRVVEEEFGDEIDCPGEPRFEFVRELSRLFETSQAVASTSGSDDVLRIAYSYIAVFGDPLLKTDPDPYPDGLLQRLAVAGVNGVWLHAVLRDLAPGGDAFPEFGVNHEQRLENLRRLVTRAKKHGIGVYIYVNEPRAMPHSFFDSRPEMAGVQVDEFTAMCTSHPAVQKWMEDALAHVFQEVPDLAGTFLITASENLTNCASLGIRQQCEHCKDRTDADVIAEVATIIEKGVHRGNLQANVVIADWGWKPWTRSDEAALAESTGIQLDESDVAIEAGGALEIIPKLPKSVTILSVSEWDLPIERGGIKSHVGEYSLSAIGPGPRAKRNWAAAKGEGLKTAAEVQFNNTCELISLPYLPVMNVVAEHCHNLAQQDLDGMLIGWTQGAYPSPNYQLAREFNRKPIPDVETALQTVATNRFGPEGASHARKAWKIFSDAYREYPFHILVVYNSPVQMGPANLLYPTRTGYAAPMLGIPYDDLDGWRGPYPREVFATQFEKLAAGWNPGIAELESAVQRAHASERDDIAADLRYARAAGITFQSVANQARYVIARDSLAHGKDALSADARERLQSEINRILNSEIALAHELYSLAKADSTIGFEPACQYFYLPQDLVEKVVNCRWLLSQSE